MPATSKTQIVITLASGWSGGPITLPIPSFMDAGRLIQQISRAGGFWDSTNTTWYPVASILSITAS